MNMHGRAKTLLFTLTTAAACSGDDGGRQQTGTGLTSATAATSAGSVSITGASATDASAGTLTGASSSSGGEGESEGSGGDTLKLDVGDDTATGGGDCGIHSPTFKESFANIWIANSTEGTVSKVDIATGVEVGRYRVAPGPADPSRTSVNLFGDVAVADRAGGLVKIAASVERCVDADQSGTIETSSGPGDVRPWGADECVLWRTELTQSTGEANAAGPRPVAWEAAIGGDACPTNNPRVWVGWYDLDTKAGEFRRLDGKTGELLPGNAVTVANWGDRKHGPYGGAVNAAGDLWAVGWDDGPLIRVDAETLEVERIEVAPPPGGAKFYLYGIAVDRHGDPWLAGEQTLYGYDVATATWTHHTFLEAPRRMRGLQIDRHDRAFIAINDADGAPGLARVDLVTLETQEFAIPGAAMPVGVSIDVEGKVWVVDRDAERAFRIEPNDFTILSTTPGLVAPYTYSDMTGAGLSLVTYPPQG